MANWNVPGITTNYVTLLDNLKSRDVDAYTMSIVSTNPPEGAIGWKDSIAKFQIYGTATGWTDLPIENGLALGTMALQDSDAVSITGGTIGTAVAIDATRLTSGLVPRARLATGTPSANNFPAGDGTYKPGIPIGSVWMWLTGSVPTGTLLLDGSAVSRTTYAALFALWSTTFGVGDGSTTFNLPNFKHRIPIGRDAAESLCDVLGEVFGSLDHVHVGASHTHSIASDGAHTHATPAITAHTHGISADGDHAHTADTGNISAGVDMQTVIDSAHNVADNPHIHQLVTNTTGAHTHGAATASGGGQAAGVTDSQGAHTHGAVTGAGGTGNTSAANPPCFTVNFIVQALG